MQHSSDWNSAEGPDYFDEKQTHEDFVFATSEQARLRALSLYIIRCIVERRGGVVEIDLATNTINIDVPDEERLDCAQEIQEKVGSLCG